MQFFNKPFSIALFLLHEKKCSVKNKFLYIGREKNITKKINLWVGLGCRLDHKLFFGPPCNFKIFFFIMSFHSYICIVKWY